MGLYASARARHACVSSVQLISLPDHTRCLSDRQPRQLRGLGYGGSRSFGARVSGQGGEGRGARGGAGGHPDEVAAVPAVLQLHRKVPPRLR